MQQDLVSSPSAFGELRQTMVDCQIRTFDVTDQVLLARLLKVPREKLVPADLASVAYSDAMLNVRAKTGETRGLLPPLVLARMLQGAQVSAADRVLDVAPTSGYSTAILAGLAGSVVALESNPDFAEASRANLAAVGLPDVQVVTGPLGEGVANTAPFDLIFVNGAVEANLDHLFAQLVEGGRLIAIQRSPEDPTGRAAKAMRFEKIAGEISSRALFDASGPVLDAFRKALAFVF
jgi:protein-L-isoaspartate(D-aspartate) O-methyltransferase